MIDYSQIQMILSPYYPSNLGLLIAELVLMLAVLLALWYAGGSIAPTLIRFGQFLGRQLLLISLVWLFGGWYILQNAYNIIKEKTSFPPWKLLEVFYSLVILALVIHTNSLPFVISEVYRNGGDQITLVYFYTTIFNQGLRWWGISVLLAGGLQLAYGLFVYPYYPYYETETGRLVRDEARGDESPEVNPAKPNLIEQAWLMFTHRPALD